jgi:signal transduction histidine kinase
MLDSMKNEFIRMATHDLRNPLNVILGYTGLLARVETNGQDADLLDEIRENIHVNVEKMRALVTDILDLARMETGGELALAPVSLVTFLERALAGFYPIAADSSITFDWRAPEYDVTVLIDGSRMTRVIDNLVSNAFKYTPEGGRITVGVVPGAECVTIYVADTGLGVPDADLPHLFDAFYRVNDAVRGEIEGSGLGLSIVKTIVEQHGGTIRVESEVGQGSVFSMALPLAPDG